jgi:hypothetical protein
MTQTVVLKSHLRLASSLAATKYQGNVQRNHKHWDIVATDRLYALNVCAVGMNCCTYKWEVHNGEIEIVTVVVKFRSQPTV